MNLNSRRPLFHRRPQSNIYRMFLWVVMILGGVWILGSLYAWALEPATAPEDTPVHGPDTSGEDLEAVPA